MFLVVGPTSFFEKLFSSHVSACSWHCSFCSFDSFLLLGMLFSPADGCALFPFCLLASPPPALLCGSLLLRGSPQAPPRPLLSIAPLRDPWFVAGTRAPQHRSLGPFGWYRLASSSFWWSSFPPLVFWNFLIAAPKGEGRQHRPSRARGTTT